MSRLARPTVRIALAALVTLIVVGCAAVGGPAAPTPPPGPIVDCLATDAQTCASALSDARANAPAGTVPFRVRVTCSQPVCLPGSGVAQVDVWYTDGSVDSYEMAWTGPDAAPPPGGVPAEPPADPILAIDPVCRGVEIGRCREMAKSIIVPVGQTGRVVSVVVTCTVARCTATDGQGTTRVAFEDGTIREADWAYAGP